MGCDVWVLSYNFDFFSPSPLFFVAWKQNFIGNDLNQSCHVYVLTSSWVYCVCFVPFNNLCMQNIFSLIPFDLFSFAGHQSRESSPTQLCEMLPRPEEKAQTSNQVQKKKNHPCNRLKPLKPDAGSFVQDTQRCVRHVISTRRKQEASGW